LVPCVCALITFFSGTDEEYVVFNAIIGMVPTFGDLLHKFVKDPTLLDLFISNMSDYMHAKVCWWLKNIIIYSDELNSKYST
jgi:hypothetical protein